MFNHMFDVDSITEDFSMNMVSCDTVRNEIASIGSDENDEFSLRKSQKRRYAFRYRREIRNNSNNDNGAKKSRLNEVV